MFFYVDIKSQQTRSESIIEIVKAHHHADQQVDDTDKQGEPYRVLASRLPNNCIFSTLFNASFSLTNLGNASNDELHTAVSSGDTYSIIFVQRFHPRIVPRSCLLLVLLHVSLYNMYGLPVSICASRIVNQSRWASTTRLAQPSCPYLTPRKIEILSAQGCSQTMFPHARILHIEKGILEMGPEAGYPKYKVQPSSAKAKCS